MSGRYLPRFTSTVFIRSAYTGGCLEVISKPRCQRSKADDGAGQDGEGEVNVGPALVSDGEAPEFGEPGECALDDPAMLSEMTAALNALPGNAMLDAALVQALRQRG